MIFAERPLFVLRKHASQFTLADIANAIEALTSAEKKVLKILLLPGANVLHPCIVEHAVAENSFSIGNNTSPAWGFFVLHSRFNHSCLPNCKIPDTIRDDTMASFATRPIDAGEEILFCYETDFAARTAADRHRALRFTCHCRACSPGSPFQQCSDMRRWLVRGLSYLIRGVDIDGKKHVRGRPLIVDRELRQAAERRQRPLSSLFIDYCLIMALLESEGLFDRLKLDSLMACVRRLAASFQTPSNAAIASRALEEPTAAERLFFAAGLYGKSDPFDHAFYELRKGEILLRLPWGF